MCVLKLGMSFKDLREVGIKSSVWYENRFEYRTAQNIELTVRYIAKNMLLQYYFHHLHRSSFLLLLLEVAILYSGYYVTICLRNTVYVGDLMVVK